MGRCPPRTVGCWFITILFILCVPSVDTLAQQIIRNQVKASFPQIPITTTVFSMTPTTTEFAAQYPTVPFLPSPFVGTILPLPNKPNDILEISIMLPHIDDHISGCSGGWQQQNEFNQSFVGRFVLVLQSECSPITDVMAAASGAAGLIVQACSPDPPFLCDARPQMERIFAPINIPHISVSFGEGENIRNFLISKRAAAVASNSIMSPDTLQVEFISSGTIIPEERQALIDIMSQTTQTSFTNGAIPPPRPDWSKARFSDPTIDPCRDRAIGIWCERGRLVMITTPYHGWASPTGLPVEFGVFTKLRMLSTIQNSLSGPIPDAWCAMTELMVLDMSDQIGTMITSIPNCVWPKLSELRITNGRLTSLPPSFGQMTTLRVISLSGHKITQIPSLAAFDQLSQLNFGENQISGPFPALHPSAPIKAISFSNNQLSGALPIDTFDGRTQLEILDLNHNQFGEGSLPTLLGCTKLTYLDLSSQRPISSSNGGFTGSLPSNWLSFKSLTTLYLQENSLVSPMETAGLSSLTELDLSHNRLTLATPTDPNNARLNEFLYALLPPSIVNCRISSNNLAGSAFSLALSRRPSMRLFWAAHNQLTGWMDELLYSPIVNLDISYNLLNTTIIHGIPAVGWLRFNIEGNPGVRLDVIPPWLVVDSTTVHRPGENFACSPVKSNTAELMTIIADPTLYNYKYCTCRSGTFGRAPLCSVVPAAAELNPFHVISSDEIGPTFPTLIQKTGGVGGDLFDVGQPTQFAQEFSDAMYGEDRQTLGLATSWVINLSNLYSDDFDSYRSDGLTPPAEHVVHRITSHSEIQERWTPVRMIIVRLHISGTIMTDFDDVLSIYEGGADLKGDRVKSIRGSDTKPTERFSDFTNTDQYIKSYNNSLSQMEDARLIEVQVFSSIATVQFTSPATSGLHFFATYQYSFECPEDGYFYDTISEPDQPRCRINYTRFNVGVGIRSAVFALGSLAMVWIAVCIVTLLWHWESLIFKAASRSFMLLVLIFLMLMALGALLYAAVPDPYTSTGDAVCIGRAWLTCLPLAGVLAVLLAKTNRLNAIFGAKTLQVTVHTDIDILIFVLVISGLQIILLSVFSGLPLSSAVLEIGHGSLSDRLVTSCNQHGGFMSWFGAEIAFIACLILPAAYLGFKTRDLPSQYNESTHIQNAIVLLLFYGVLIIPLDIFIQDSPEAAVLIQGLGQAFLCILLTTIIFGPKLYHLIQHGGRTSPEQTQHRGGVAQKSYHGSSIKSDIPSQEETMKAPTTPQRYPFTNRPSVTPRSPFHPQSLTKPVETSAVALHLTPMQSPVAQVEANNTSSHSSHSQPSTPVQLPATRLIPSTIQTPTGVTVGSTPVTPNTQSSTNRRIIHFHTHGQTTGTASPDIIQSLQNALASPPPIAPQIDKAPESV